MLLRLFLLSITRIIFIKMSNDLADLTDRKHHSINVNSAIIVQLLRQFALGHRLSYGRIGWQTVFVYLYLKIRFDSAPFHVYGDRDGCSVPQNGYPLSSIIYASSGHISDGARPGIIYLWIS